jgi:hypothetical protein
MNMQQQNMPGPPGQNAMRQQQQQQQQPMPQQNMPPTAPQGMPMMPQQMQQMNPNAMSIGQKYVVQTSKFIPALNPNNPHMKQQVGGCIYEYVHNLVGEDKAPKITGMLIELPVAQIKEYMTDYNNLQAKVQEALNHWESAQKDMGQ